MVGEDRRTNEFSARTKFCKVTRILIDFFIKMHLRRQSRSRSLSPNPNPMEAMVRLDGERILREQDRSSFGKNQYRMLIYTILCADRHLAENVLSDQYLFTNIEDFLWFKLVLVREGQLTTLTSSTYTHEEPHRLAELQQQLAQYPANYYTRDGKEPLLYAILLLLTLQFEGVIQYLAAYTPTSVPGDASYPYAIEAVHLCIIFSYYGVFNLGTDIRSRQSMLCSDIVVEFARCLFVPALFETWDPWF